MDEITIDTSSMMENITTRYEQVKDQTTEDYFGGNKFSIDAFNKKYTTINGETYTQALKRVCDYVASVEKTPKQKEYWSDKWFDEIYNDWWHPAGSIMQGAGSGRKISMANCFSRDTEFITDKGVKSFLDFQSGDEVKILSNFGGFKSATVKSFGLQEVVKLTLRKKSSYKEVICTPNHNWRVLDGGSIVVKETQSLEILDKLPYIKRKWMEGKSGRYYCPIGFIHGLVFGDGSLYKEGDYCNLDLIGDSKNYSKFFVGLHWNIRETELGYRISYLPNYMKQLPDFDKVNSEYILGFIIGWFAADGTIDTSGRAYLYHNNKETLIKIKKVLESVGIYTSEEIQTRRDTKEIEIGGKIYANRDYKLYSLYFLKDCLFSSFFVKDNHVKNYNESLTKNIEKQNWVVVGLEQLNRTEEVWCIVEPESHNFTLQGGVNTGNCTTTTLGAQRLDEEWDNLESIIKNNAYTIAKCAAYRQGLGCDFSRLRPEGMTLLNSANVSTGAVHWMKFTDGIGYFVGQCLDGEALIETNRGKIKIKEIVNNENESYEALTHGGYKPIINKFKNGIKKIYTLKLEDGSSLDLTEDHKVVVFDGIDEKFKMVDVKDINFETDKLVRLVE